MPYPTSPGRYLAPLALLAAVIATFLVARTAGTVDTSSSPATSPKVQRHTALNGSRRTYVVRAGDTLSGIAAKTGVSLERIESLNESVDAAALHVGQKIKLVAR